jgi:fructose-1,6-bisphosphatase/inositol monophosphatase family enzyme
LTLDFKEVTLSLCDTTTIEAILRDAARADILPRFRRLVAADIRAKTGPLDLVTEADEAAERTIAAALRAAFPGCLVIGEEATAANPALLDSLGAADLAFVVDPIDGTSNYAAGLTLFGSMAAAIVRGEVAAAIIHDPIGDDTAIALRGEGAWTTTADGRRTALCVTPPVPVDQMSGVVSWRYLPASLRTKVCANLPLLAAAWDLRCAAHEYRMIAAGHCHFLMFHRLLPWDHAPGWLLHREAGGFSARFDGTPYTPAERAGGLICTSDEASFLALRQTLLER